MQIMKKKKIKWIGDGGDEREKYRETKKWKQRDIAKEEEKTE